MKKNKITKKKIISFIVITIIVVITIFAYNSYCRNELQKKIDAEITQLNKIEKNFNDKDKKEDKLIVLQSLLKSHEEYENSKDMNEKVDNAYHESIANMKKVLKDGYDTILKENTLDNIETIDNKEQLNKSNSNLKNLLQTIQKEQEIVCTKNEVAEYENKINTLITSYTARLDVIQEERKAKEEAEAKAAEEQQKQQQQNAVANSNANNSGNSHQQPSNGGGNSNSSNSNNSGNSSSNSNSNSSQNNSTWHDGMTYRWIENEKGLMEFYQDYKGNMYDMNGNYIGNWYDEWF